MANATVTRIVETNNPQEETVVLTASDGEIYTSRKFNTIQGAVGTLNGTTGTANSVSFSGTMAKVHGSFTDQLYTLTLVGE